MTVLRTLLILLLLALPTAGLGADGPVTLRDAVTVKGSRVTLGDLFENIGGAAKINVAHAPKPGKSVAARAPWLARMAKTHGLDWRPDNADVQVVVTRAGQLITRDDIEWVLLDALADRIGADRLGLEFSTRRIEFHVATLKIPEIGVESLDYDRRTKRFAATIRVPVVVRAVHKGETIRETDIQWQQVRVDRLRGDYLTDQDDVVGLAARRLLRPEKPLRRVDLERPLLVRKRQAVTIILRHGAMTMTARGKAEENGALGEVVAVRNTGSGRTIETEVVGPDIVAVTLGRPHHLALNLGAPQ